MIKELDDDLKESLAEMVLMVDDVFESLFKYSNEEDKQKIKTLTKAFEDLGIQYNVKFKVEAIKKTIDDLDALLKETLEAEV